MSSSLLSVLKRIGGICFASVAAFIVLVALVRAGEVDNASSSLAQEQSQRRDSLANLPFSSGFLAKEAISTLKDELIFQRAVQSTHGRFPALNMYGMKEGSEKVFGKGYNVLPIFKDRLNAKTLITTPNSDVIYALGYLDLKEDGPIVIEVPPGLQGILDDFWQRPICSEGEINGRVWCGDVGLPGPDQGKGGKYLILPPDFKGTTSHRLLHAALTHLWRVRVLAGLLQGSQAARGTCACAGADAYLSAGQGSDRQADAISKRIGDARPTCSTPADGTAFDMIDRFIQHEYADPVDMEMRGVLAALGIEKGKPVQSPRACARRCSTREQGRPSASATFDHLRAAGNRAERALVQGQDAGPTCFRATRRSPARRSTTLTRALGSLRSRIRRAQAWPPTWST